MMSSLVTLFISDVVMMTIRWSSRTSMELPLDHVFHQVISGVGTPEALQRRLMDVFWSTALLSGGSMMYGSAGGVGGGGGGISDKTDN